MSAVLCVPEEEGESWETESGIPPTKCVDPFRMLRDRGREVEGPAPRQLVNLIPDRLPSPLSFAPERGVTVSARLVSTPFATRGRFFPLFTPPSLDFFTDLPSPRPSFRPNCLMPFLHLSAVAAPRC
jgi:hypothetical protein